MAQSAAPEMRVLQLHNRYRLPGGEERALADITDLLRRRGHTVEVLERSSTEIGRRRAARGLLEGGIEPEEVGRAVRRMRADVVHAHNLHPLFGWRSLAAAREAGARTVLHLHNFRLFCAISVAYRDGRPCFRCHGTNTMPGLRLRCRGSVSEAAAYAAGLSRQQQRIYEHVDRFLVVSEATLTRLHQLGLPPGRSSVLHNFVPSASFASESRAHQGDYALVSGRLVEEKGFDTAIAAARDARVPLVIAGDGPDRTRLRGLALGPDAARLAGRLTPAELATVRAGAGVVLAPSRWEEPCPYSVLDAMAAGVPVLTSDLGGLPELVGGDAMLSAFDQGAWTMALDRLWRDPELRRGRGEAELTRAREHFGEERYCEGLLRVYEESGARLSSAG